MWNLITPSVLAATERGLLAVMSDGSLWDVKGDDAIPRAVSAVIGATSVAAPRQMAATPGGEFLLLVSGSGTAYLYDALSDDFVQARTVQSAPFMGYYGPIAAAAKGQYYLVNSMVLGPALSQLSNAATATAVGGQTVQVPRPIDQCPFLHIRPEDRIKDCPWYARGFCKHGPTCRNRHARKEPCLRYLAGFCPDGPDCQVRLRVSAYVATSVSASVCQY